MARRKSKSKREENTPAGGTPSDSEWLTMQPCDKIAVCTEDSVEYPFCVGDTVSLLSPDGKRDEWYAKIEDIRQREGEDNDVWVKVRWYYSPEEVDNAINGVEGKSNRKSLGEETDMVFDPEFCSPTERILSDHCDIIHSLSLEDVVKITFFDESNLLEQKDITHGELFCRYTLSIHPFDNPPKLSAPVSPCLCSRGYNLSQSDPAQAMRVCAECKRPWHHTCLVSGGFSEDVGLEKILHGILGQQDAEQESRVDRSPQKKRRLDAASRQSPYSSRRFLTLLERTPPSLLLLAAQPLIRGSCRSIPLPIPLPAPSFADSSHLPSSPSKRSAKHAKKTSTNNNIDLPITSKYTTPKSLPITGNVRAVTRARRKLRSLALVLGREVTDYETDEEDEEDEEDAQTQTPARLGKRKLSRIEVSKPSAKSTSTSKSKGKNKNNAPKDRGRTQTKGKGKGRGRSSRTSLSKARSISDVDTDDTGAGDLSREEEYQVLQALEPSDESSPGSPSGSLAPLPPPYTPPPSSPELGPVSLPSPATRSKRTAASSSLPKKSKAAGLQGRAQTESDANWLGEWEPEPGWEGFIVTPIRLPASFFA
ncbi:hypothetical protein D9758_005433 [Tetrapyrgos nigripes]|uniref:BAH domain-containing protein n=1 Tax=Tetrapyrgos nigripes TaxID=182062 RepID=A0A8H5LQ64_9AGAR|nr:hypothetical protein D9758_005433 [Tetrapyrgos nigripes]